MKSLGSSPALVPRGSFTSIAAINFFVFSSTALYAIAYAPSPYEFSDRFAAVVDSATLPDGFGVSLRTKYTGVEAIDYPLRFLVTAFLPGIAGLVKEAQIQQAYFLVSFFPMITIYTIEAGRNGASSKLISYTSLWAMLYQTAIGAVILPLYHLVFLYHTAKTDYYTSKALQLPLSYARGLIPALVLGYLMPTMALYAPFQNPDLAPQQVLAAFWQITPLVVNILLGLFSRTLGTPHSSSDENNARYDSAMKYLNAMYAMCLIGAAFAHFAVFYICIHSPEVSLARIFVPQHQLLGGSVTEVLFYIFQVDYLVIFTSSLLWAFVATNDLRLLHRTSTSLVQIALLVAGGVILVGPAATVTAIWWWRETRLRDESRTKTL